MKLVALAGAILILLTVAKAIAPELFSFLPLGGSAIAEMGIVFGTAVAIAAILQIRWRESG